MQTFEGKNSVTNKAENLSTKSPQHFLDSASAGPWSRIVCGQHVDLARGNGLVLIKYCCIFFTYFATVKEHECLRCGLDGKCWGRNKSSSSVKLKLEQDGT